MGLCARALDQMPTLRQKTLDSLPIVIGADPVLLRGDTPKGLVKRQNRILDPVLSWATTEFRCEFKKGVGFGLVKQPDASVRRLVEEYERVTNLWTFAALDSLISLSHSLIIPLAFWRHKLSLEEACQAVRTEEDYQIRQHGWVEGAYGHGVDYQYTKQTLGAARNFLTFLEDEKTESISY